MSAVLVSVIVATRNRHERVAATVASLVDQDLSPAAYEIVVIDDGSSPPISLPGPIKVIHVKPLERSAARNSGAANARAPLLLFVDDDLTFGRDFVATHLAAHVEWPGSLVVGRIALPDGIVSTPFGRFRQKLDGNGLPSTRGIVRARNFCTAANMSIDASAFRSLGGFAPSMVSGEDQDFAMRHTALGGEIVFIPESVAIHHDNAVDIRSYCKRTEWGHRNIVPFVMRHREWPDNKHRIVLNGPLQPGREPIRASALKLVKDVAASFPFRQFLFAATLVLERLAPGAGALDRLYRLLIGIHARRGFRRGWALRDQELKA